MVVTRSDAEISALPAAYLVNQVPFAYERAHSGFGESATPRQRGKTAPLIKDVTQFRFEHVFYIPAFGDIFNNWSIDDREYRDTASCANYVV